MENLRYFVVVNTYNNRQYQPIDVSFFADGVRCVTYDDFGGEDVFLKNGEFEIEWIDVVVDKRTEADYNADMEREVIKAEEQSRLFYEYKIKVEKDMQDEYPEHFKYVELIKKIAQYTGKSSAFDIIEEYVINRDISGVVSPEDADNMFADFNEFITTHNWFFFTPTFGCDVTYYPSRRHNPDEYSEFMRTEVKNIIEDYDKQFKNRLGVDFSKLFKASILRRVYYRILHKRLAEFYEKNI
jgi:hypothetical protein